MKVVKLCFILSIKQSLATKPINSSSEKKFCGFFDKILCLSVNNNDNNDVIAHSMADTLLRDTHNKQENSDTIIKIDGCVFTEDDNCASKEIPIKEQVCIRERRATIFEFDEPPK